MNNTILRTFGLFTLCFFAVFAILYFIGIQDPWVLNFLCTYILYRLLKENGI